MHHMCTNKAQRRTFLSLKKGQIELRLKLKRLLNTGVWNAERAGLSFHKQFHRHWHRQTMTSWSCKCLYLKLTLHMFRLGYAGLQKYLSSWSFSRIKMLTCDYFHFRFKWELQALRGRCEPGDGCWGRQRRYHTLPLFSDCFFAKFFSLSAKSQLACGCLNKKWRRIFKSPLISLIYLILQLIIIQWWPRSPNDRWFPVSQISILMLCSSCKHITVTHGF